MKRIWNNKLTYKFFLSYLAVVLLLFVSFFIYFSTLLKEFYISSLSKTLQQQARVVMRLVPPQTTGTLDAFLREISQDLGARVTVIDEDGTVLGDSDEPSALMENHGSRPEVLDAIGRGTGSSIRFSTTVGYDMLYQAVPQDQNGKKRIMRLALPLRDIDDVVSRLRSALFIGLVLLSTLGLAGAFFFSRRIGARVERMAEFSQEVARGSFPQNFFPDDGSDELHRLERNLNDMSLRIREKIGEIVTEKEKLDSILRCMIEGLLVIDTKGRLVLSNRQARTLFDLPPTRDIRGASFMEVSRHPEMKQLMEEVLANDLTSGTFSKEIFLDEKRWLRINAVSLRNGQEQLIGYVLVFHDITELKRLEAIRTDFVANVSHELRTPLTAIRGYVETLLRTPPSNPKDSEHFLEIVERHADRLTRLTDDLLTLSDLESGRVQLSVEPLEAKYLIQRVLEVFQDRAAKKGVELADFVAAGLARIFGDSDRLQQLLINLVDNALKNTPAGGRVEIHASGWTQSNGSEPRVQLTVVDTGPGIAEKDLPRLTERFYRVDKTRSRELGGTGLGLAIVKHIVQAHRGELKIESQLNRGTTVRVFLPAVAQATKHNVTLFLCTANSCRSQMAEGFARHLAPSGERVYSAGTAPKGIHALAIKVMQEVGIDISAQQSKGLESIPLDEIGRLVTLCGEAAESCPTMPKKVERIHWPLRDPALAQGSQQEIVQVFREVRDEIRDRVEKLLAPGATVPTDAPRKHRAA